MTRNTFEDRLLTELKEEIAARAADEPAPASARPRLFTPLRLTAVATATAAVAGALIVGLPGGTGTSPAYAVERNQDGSVTITWNEYLEAESRSALWEELSPALIEAGAHVIQEPESPLSCGAREYIPLDQPGGAAVQLMRVLPDGTWENAGVFMTIPDEPAGRDGHPEPEEEGAATVRAGDTVIFDTGSEGMSVTAVYEGVTCAPVG
ncbi:hypothetical protein [Streptomyces johnsoniae]|uniref:Uncharacterized protein n=1 Tax=Streptomyces johnsoniae TaxID=3075532 RepID=A0ABU2S2E1_9ACTN|nr:hypothetical protein [Streptomyces sp. DSM 41886]MDT0443062.1 hypothetical protein [Streptomyces sp. DSM 41886]